MIGTPRRNLGITIPGLSTIVNDVEASARAQIYQQLASFQALPQRLNRVSDQLAAFASASPSRGLDESARLSALQTNVASAQANWNTANNQVTQAINALSGNVSVSGTVDVAAAVAAMTLATSDTSSLEQDARDLINSSIAIDDSTRQALLALGAPAAFTMTQLLLFGGLAYLAVRFMRNR